MFRSFVMRNCSFSFVVSIAFHYRIIFTIICYTVDFNLISGVGVAGNAVTLSPR